MAYNNIELSGFTNFVFTPTMLSMLENNNDFNFLNRNYSDYITLNSDMNPQSYAINDVIWATSSGITVTKISRNYSSSFAISLNGTQIYSRNDDNINRYYSGIGFVIDDVNQTAKVVTVTRQYVDTGNNDRTYVSTSLTNNSNGLYQALKQAIPVLYTWQSVPSISGKNGILSLVTLDSESINDGEPVSGAAISVFDQNPASGNNVKDIVDGNTPLIPSAVDVTAAFIISNPPIGELASRILAAKKGSIPESIEDADKTVSIPANASNVTMPGLDENSQYYFAIFVADAVGDTAVSDPKDIITGERPIVPSPEVIMIVEKALIDGYEEYISAELAQ